MKGTIGAAVAVALALSAGGEVREVAGCRAAWDGASIKVGNGLFSREYAVGDDGVLRTVSFRTVGGMEWQRDGEAAGKKPSPDAKIDAEPGRWSPVGAEGLKVRVLAQGRETEIWVLPGVPGTIVKRAWTDAVKPVRDAERDFRRRNDYAALC